MSKKIPQKNFTFIIPKKTFSTKDKEKIFKKRIFAIVQQGVVTGHIDPKYKVQVVISSKVMLKYGDFPFNWLSYKIREFPDSGFIKITVYNVNLNELLPSDWSNSDLTYNSNPLEDTIAAVLKTTE